MAPSLYSLPRNAIRRLQRSRVVMFGELPLPPRGLRLGGAHFRDDRVFVESGRQDVEKLRSAFGVDASSSVLDVGCGVGRLPIGLLAEFGQLSDYVGVDVDRISIEWCKQHIESNYPRIQFVHLDVENDRYNQAGTPIDHSFQFPWAGDRFDVIFLYSVFSHMLEDDVRVYLREFRRLLRPEGGVFLTAFVEEGVPEATVNPPGYGQLKWRGPLHCVRFSREFFDDMVEEAGLSIARYEQGSETDGQSAIYLMVAEGGNR